MNHYRLVMGDHYHFIGIGGIGMSALAHILLDRGVSVSGSDLFLGSRVEDLQRRGAVCHLGHRNEHIKDQTVVVYSSGITPENVEYREACKRGYRMIHRAQLLAQLMAGSQSILVSGSHGKTTTAALLTTIFQQAGFDPSFAIGGLNAQGVNGRSGRSPYFIAEADESDGSIQYYVPDAVIITNLDNEHLCNFSGDMEKLVKTLESFSNRVADPSRCWYNGESSHLINRICGQSFGFSSTCDLHIFSCRQEKWQSTFSLAYQGRVYQDIQCNLIGKHNIANAAAAIGIALSYGISEEVFRAALKSFAGVKRRLERKNISERFLFFEDYAHHPAEIACTLGAIREAVGLRRMIAVCQPHRFSRLNDCMEQFLGAFQSADEVILTDVYSAGEKQIDVAYTELVRNIAYHSCVQCQYVPYQELASYLRGMIRTFDVCVALGAGDIDRISEELKYFNPSKLSLGIICGGRSCEHEISLLSASNLAPHFSQDYYDLHYFVIDSQGLWNKVSEIPKEMLWGGQSVLSPEIMQSLQKMDVVLPVLHGPNGEDGTIQGFFEILGKPYGGPSLAFATLSMDKVLTKQLAASVGVPIVPFQMLTLHNWKQSPDSCLKKILSAFSFPVFVKSTRLGSSIGVFEVHDVTTLEASIHEAFMLGNEVLIEESRLGSREIEVSCLGDASSYYYVAGAHERRGTGGTIDYYEKYGIGKPGAEVLFNLDLSDEAKSTVRELAERVYRVLQGKGSGRVDFFLDQEGSFWLSEVNAIPGMTLSSPFLQAFVCEGWTLQQIADQLVIEGLHRFDQQQRVMWNPECLVSSCSS